MPLGGDLSFCTLQAGKKLPWALETCWARFAALWEQIQKVSVVFVHFVPFCVLFWQKLVRTTCILGIYMSQSCMILNLHAVYAAKQDESKFTSLNCDSFSCSVSFCLCFKVIQTLLNFGWCLYSNLYCIVWSCHVSVYLVNTRLGSLSKNKYRTYCSGWLLCFTISEIAKHWNSSLLLYFR